jgi:2-methylaconitate cis-trans-isomerase PrpF
MTSAVALYTVMEGLVPATEPMTTFTLLNLNTGTRVRAHVPTGPTGPLSEGTFRMAGISTPGAEIVTEYLDPAGRDGEFPTGNRIDTVRVDGVGDVTMSIVDISSPLVFVRASDLGLSGTELPDRIDGDPELLARLERIRGTAAVHLGLVDAPAAAARRTPGIPKMAFVTSPCDYETSLGTTVRGEDVDIVARVMSVQRAHHAYSMTGALCTAAAAMLEGTVPRSVIRPDRTGSVRIGHPKGVTTVGTTLGDDGSTRRVAAVAVSRTARCLMRGLIEHPGGA